MNDPLWLLRNRSQGIQSKQVGQRFKEWGLLPGHALRQCVTLMLPVAYSDATGQAVDFETAGRATLAVMAWMATWWLTECIDLSATALLPLVVFSLCLVSQIWWIQQPLTHIPLIFLFMGGFIQALSMRRWGLDQRIALVTLRLVGTKPVNMVAGFMIVTAGLSAFVSNTATAALMLPIALKRRCANRRQCAAFSQQNRRSHSEWRYRQEFDDVLDAWHCLRRVDWRRRNDHWNTAQRFFWLVFSEIRFPSRIEWK